KAIEDTKYFIKTFASKKPADAANAFFSLTSVYEKQSDPDVVINHLPAYIRQYGDNGGVDRLVTAYAKIGEILWTQSCPVKTVYGSCVRVSRERALASKQKKSKERKKGSDQPTQ